MSDSPNPSNNFDLTEHEMIIAYGVVAKIKQIMDGRIGEGEGSIEFEEEDRIPALKKRAKIFDRLYRKTHLSKWAVLRTRVCIKAYWNAYGYYMGFEMARCGSCGKIIE